MSGMLRGIAKKAGAPVGKRALQDSPLQEDKSRAWQAFLIALGLAFLLFIPHILNTGGYFTYYGDFNAQQIPFYRMCHDAVRAGDFSWNWTTDLGVNFIGSYSFYLLGSPFFWLTIPFPSAAVPYMIAPLLMLKMALMSLTAYLYLHRFVRSDYAVLGGIMYSFSGFSIYNIFFNHFHEAMVYFPLILYALERFMKDGKRGLFAVTMFLSAINNYYFFIGQCVFLIIYWLVRAASHAWDLTPAKFGLLIFEAAIGTAVAGVLLLPSYYSVIQNSRTTSIISGWASLYTVKSQRFWDIIHSFFFPPDLAARPNFFPDADNKWASMSAWLPMFGCTGAIAFFQSRKHKNWLHRLLIILVICTEIPLFNSMFQLFNSAYYARWYYMLTMMLITATVMCIESKPSAPQPNWPRAFGWSLGITAFFVGILAYMPKSWTPTNGKIESGLYKDKDRFWTYVAVVLIGLALSALVLYIKKKKPKWFYSVALVCLCGISIGYSWYMVGQGHEISTYHAAWVKERAIEGIDKINLPEQDEWSRIDVNSSMDNMGIYWEIPCIQAFHSIVPGALSDFYESIGVHRGVASRPGQEHYAIRGLLSVKWMFDYANTEGQHHAKNSTSYFESSDGTMKEEGFTYAFMQNGFKVYRNNNFVPMGFTYEGYITRTEYKQLSSDDNREQMLMKVLVVEDADVRTVAPYLPHVDPQSVAYGYDMYVQDCNARRASAATSFKAYSTGFTATIEMDKANFAFFTVPYESGWSATVNGKPATVIKSGVGFMAVLCEAGVNQIEFTYRTPGLAAGALVTAGSAVVLAVYFGLPYAIVWWKKRRETVAVAASETKEDRKVMKAVKAKEAKAASETPDAPEEPDSPDTPDEPNA